MLQSLNSGFLPVNTEPLRHWQKWAVSGGYTFAVWYVYYQEYCELLLSWRRTCPPLRRCPPTSDHAAEGFRSQHAASCSEPDTGPGSSHRTSLIMSWLASLPSCRAGSKGFTRRYYCLLAESCLTLVTPWTVACQAPLSRDFPGKNTGVGCHFLLRGNLLDPQTEPVSPAWQTDPLPLSHHQGSPYFLVGKPNANCAYLMHLELNK